MNKLKCIVVDDEPLAMDIIESYINKNPNVELIGKCSSALEAAQMLKHETPDILLLDIQMPEITGMEFAKTLDTSKVLVVFTTAYQEYAAEAFEINALDYLVKPIPYERFEAMCSKALEFVELKKDASEISNAPESGHIFVKSDQKMIKVNYGDIKYVEAFADYVKIYIQEGKRIVTLQTMKKMNELLPKNQFCRIHRSYIVNLSRINSYNGTEVNVGEKVIPIGKNFKQDFVLQMKS